MPSSKWFFLVYNLPLLAIAIYWVLCRARKFREFRFLALAIDLIVFACAASRFLGPFIPASGHALFLTHSLLTTDQRTYRVISSILLVGTVAMKLSWGDYRSWPMGIAAALISAALWTFVNKRAHPSKQENESSDD